MTPARERRETFLRYIAKTYDVELAMFDVYELGALMIDHKSGQRLRIPTGYAWDEDEVLAWIHALRD